MGGLFLVKKHSIHAVVCLNIFLLFGFINMTGQ